MKVTFSFFPYPHSLYFEVVTLQCPASINEVADMFDGQGEYRIVNYPDAAVFDSSGGSGSVQVSYTHSSGDKYHVGITPVTVNATHSCNNLVTCSFTIEVRPCKYI